MVVLQSIYNLLRTFNGIASEFYCFVISDECNVEDGPNEPVFISLGTRYRIGSSEDCLSHMGGVL